MTAAVLSVFDVLVWHSVLVDDVLIPVVEESVGASVRGKPHRIAAGEAVMKAVLAADEWLDVPRRFLDIGQRVPDQPPAETAVAAVTSPVVQEDAGTFVPAGQESTGAPVRIRIPSIAVDAAIERVALAADGSMDVPKHPENTAWYAPGPRPGDTGSAAIAGHVDSKSGGAAVFADLHKVRSGDKIAVQDDKGTVTSFVVRASRRYDAAADATDVFTSNDGKAHLNIITCVGAWDKRTKQYAERLVVFTDKVTE